MSRSTYMLMALAPPAASAPPARVATISQIEGRPLGRHDHRRHRRDQQQLDDPRLGQRHIGTEARTSGKPDGLVHVKEHTRSVPGGPFQARAEPAQRLRSPPGAGAGPTASGANVLFPTIRFAIFFALVLPASWLLMPKPVRWRVFMIAASFFFYASWNSHYALLLAGLDRRQPGDGQRDPPGQGSTAPVGRRSSRRSSATSRCSVGSSTPASSPTPPATGSGGSGSSGGRRSRTCYCRSGSRSSRSKRSAT